MNQGTQGYCLLKKTKGQKSRETVPPPAMLHSAEFKQIRDILAKSKPKSKIF
jgi:hypothetical protein